MEKDLNATDADNMGIYGGIVPTRKDGRAKKEAKVDGKAQEKETKVPAREAKDPNMAHVGLAADPILPTNVQRGKAKAMRKATSEALKSTGERIATIWSLEGCATWERAKAQDT